MSAYEELAAALGGRVNIQVGGALPVSWARVGDDGEWVAMTLLETGAFLLQRGLLDLSPLPEVGPNLIRNGDFTAGRNEWSYHAGAGGSFEVVDEPGGGRAARLSVAGPSENIQLYQPGLSLEGETRYRLRFGARSNDGSHMSVLAHQHEFPYDNAGLAWPSLELAGERQVFEREFTTPAGVDMSDVRLRFWFAGHAAAGSVYHIDSVELAAIEVA